MVHDRTTAIPQITWQFGALSSCKHRQIPVRAHGRARRVHRTRGRGERATMFTKSPGGNPCGDDPASVERNRGARARSLGTSDVPLVVPSQVHGEVVVELDDASPEALGAAREAALAGADALVATVPGIAALLCFADCVPVIVVSPTGRFAVAHAGWRGVENGVAAKAVRALARARLLRQLGRMRRTATTPYVGPHTIHASHKQDRRRRAQALRRPLRFLLHSRRTPSLCQALTVGLEEAGIDRARVADAGVCTVCSCDEFFSYRAAGGICGRHGAVAFRKAG